MADRRSFLRGLVTLPLIVGGTVVIFPQAAAAIVPPLPVAFDPAAFVTDLAAAGYSVIAHRSVPRGGERTSIPSYVIQPRRGRGFGKGYIAVMARWNAAMDACPDHVEHVVAYAFSQPSGAHREAAHV